MLGITVALAALLAQEMDHQAHAAHLHEDEGEPHQHDHAAGEVGLAGAETTRIASGTAWQPAGTPHSGWHWGAGRWQLMLHGIFFAGFDWQAGPRGGQAGVGVGWVMGMARRDGATNSLVFRAMLSPEPWTVRDGGYPLLLQTGETYRGLALHDRQHPHDLVMELAALFTQALGSAVAVQGYAALAGEPALGPVAFPHRFSASADPMATLGHHWMDSTHISFGVLTLGLVSRRMKLEGSWFNGKEPDERRTDLDLRRPDAFAGRLSVMPVDSIVAQLSYGHLPNPGGDHPGALDRATASVSHHLLLEDGGHLATLLAVGWNREHASAAAVLAESLLDLDGANLVFARLEYVRKSGHDLALGEPLDEGTYDLLAVSLGYLRNLPALVGIVPGLGLRAAGTYLPGALGPAYGGRRFPVGGMVYLRLVPKAMHHM
jgi:hypothetical protein